MQQGLKTNISLPPVPQFPPSRTQAIAIDPSSKIGFSQLVTGLVLLYKWANSLVTYLNQTILPLVQVVNTARSTFGVDIASANTIIVTNSQHHVTGTAPIQHIQVPPDFSGGPIYFVPEGTWSLITGGNIALAATAVVHEVMVLDYDPVDKLFYPSYTGPSGGSPSISVFIESIGASPFSVPAASETFIFASASSSADFIVNLPPATGSKDKIVIKKMDANAHSVDVTPNGSDTIDDSNSPTSITIQYDAIRLIDYTTGKWAIW